MDEHPDAPRSDNFDSLRAAIPVEWDDLSDILASEMAGLNSLIQSSNGKQPYNSTTKYLLHFWHHVAPLLPVNKLQLLLWIIHHPEFTIADVPKTENLSSWTSTCLLFPQVRLPDSITDCQCVHRSPNSHQTASKC